MTEHDDGGQVFPMGYHPDGNLADHQGMTLRQWYAGRAMQGLLASVPDGAVALPENVAENARIQADALIAELKK